MRAAVARLTTSRPGLAWKRYAEARGNILAAGIGYFAFFSIFPAVALAFCVFGFVLNSHPDLLRSVLDQLSGYLPGLVEDGGPSDGLIPARAPEAVALTVTGVIAFVTLVLAGLGWLGAVREGIRAIFGVSGSGGNLVNNLARDLGVLFTLGVGIALVAVLTTGVGAGAGWIATAIGLSGDGSLVAFAGFVVSLLADTALMILLLRVVSGVRAPWRDLFQGALVGGVGFSLLKISAAALLPRLTANPLYASFAIVVGLLIWLNLIARLTLISASWAANDVEHANSVRLTGQIQDQSVTEPRPRADGQVPDSAVLSRPEKVRGTRLPTFGSRSLDRVALGSGAVLGAAAVAAAGALARGVRSIIARATD